jgi:hypothetical protein
MIKPKCPEMHSYPYVSAVIQTDNGIIPNADQ